MSQENHETGDSDEDEKRLCMICASKRAELKPRAHRYFVALDWQFLGSITCGGVRTMCVVMLTRAEDIMNPWRVPESLSGCGMFE